MVGIAPLDIFARILGGSSSLVAWLRVTKLLFLRYVYFFFNRSQASSRSRLVQQVQMLLFLAFGLLHWLTCVWFYITYGYERTYLALNKNYEGEA
jgi:hypothetical protein